jgi:hypothetical protein
VIGKGTVHVLRVGLRLTKTGVEIGDERWRIGVRSLDRIDVAQTQLLDQTVLQRLVGALDSSLGLRSVGADDVDVELVKGPPKLRQARGAILLRRMRGAEYAMLVAIKGDRLAPFLKLRLGGMEVVEDVLRSGKAQLQQFARGVVDIDEQGALRAAVLKPPVMRTIDWHQFAKAIAPAARLMQLPFTFAT